MTTPTPSPASNNIDVDVSAAVNEDGQAVAEPDRDPAAALTTDEKAQRDDTPVQPGNS